MVMHLAEVRSFGDLARGNVVAGTTRIADIMDSAHACCVAPVVTPANKGA
jgi:hypothetical protein